MHRPLPRHEEVIKGNLVPRIISVWEAVGLHHSWKPRLFLLVTATRVAVPFLMVTVLYLFSQPRPLALL